MKAWVLAAMTVIMLGGVARAQDDDPAGPQPKLPTERLSILADNGKTYVFAVELPVTAIQQQTGEMFRTEIPADAGMLFVWDQPEISEMWMKNCPVPEDMVNIGADGLIKSINENTVPYSLKPLSSTVPVVATLELQGGITATDDISVGDKVIAKQFAGG